jgi:AraC-like DNA-binding protein
MICSTYVRLECDPSIDHRDGFDGSIEHHKLPGLELSVVRSGPQTVLRTRSAIARDPEDCFLIATQTRGHGMVEQDGRETLMAPGEFSIYDSSRPYTLRFSEDFEEVVLKVRGDALRAVVRNAESLTATKVSGNSGPGRILHGMLQALRGDLDTLPSTSASAVGDSLLSLVAAGLGTLRGAPRVESTALKAYHLERIRTYIDQHLHEPSLTVEAIALKLGMSVSHLHRLFAGEPLSPAQYVWHRRMERCCRDLLDPQLASRPVSEIAFRWGYNDAAHFSRSFRERYGCPPREWRQQGLLGNAVALTSGVH